MPKHFNEFICNTMVHAEAQSQWGYTHTDKVICEYNVNCVRNTYSDWGRAS